MYIPPSSAASAAASSISQAASKDRSSGGQVDAAQITTSTQVEQVARGEAASPDRDAQGGGQGLGAHDRQPADGQPGHHPSAARSHSDAADMPVHDPEPPSELDIVG